MRSSDIDKINEILFNLVNGRDFVGVKSFFHVVYGLDAVIISKFQKGIVVIDSKTGQDVVFIPFREYL